MEIHQIESKIKKKVSYSVKIKQTALPIYQLSIQSIHVLFPEIPSHHYFASIIVILNTNTANVKECVNFALYTLSKVTKWVIRVWTSYFSS